MYWLDLYCPRLPLEVFAFDPADITAVVESRGARETLVACNDAAERAGLTPGMALGAARAQAPGVRVLQRDPAAERAALERLAAACLAFTDHVSLDPPTDVLLEIGGSRRLFGGLRALCEQISAMVTRLGRTASRGLAPVPSAARLLAHRGGGRIDPDDVLAERLAPLPWQALDLDPDTAKRLQGWGVTTLGACFALPREGIARRLGPAFLARLDRLRGALAESPARFDPPQRFEGVVPLPDETATLELPLRAVERLLHECEAWLRARDAAVQTFRVELHARSGARTDIEVGLVTPTREAGHMLTLARERLERTDAGTAVVAVGIRAGEAMDFQPAHTDLWTGAGAEPPERLLERLRARLGRDAVHGLALSADHRPERAWTAAAPGALPVHEPTAVPPRPLWLLEQPGMLPMDAERRPQCRGALELLDGPERIETGWWDGDDVERDYFVARDPGGSLLWIYRERRVPALWYLHGLFA